MNYDPKNPKWEGRDRFILSKAHCSETLYNIFADMGMYTQDYMVEHFECLDKSEFGMHSNRKYVPAIEVSAGSLGHGLPIAVGMALGARVRKENYLTIVMVGDGELDEGTNWEALQSGAHYQLNNLVCIIDKNQLQMTGTTEEITAPEKGPQSRSVSASARVYPSAPLAQSVTRRARRRTSFPSMAPSTTLVLPASMARIIANPLPYFFLPSPISRTITGLSTALTASSKTKFSPTKPTMRYAPVEPEKPTCCATSAT